MPNQIKREKIQQGKKHTKLCRTRRRGPMGTVDRNKKYDLVMHSSWTARFSSYSYRRQHSQTEGQVSAGLCIKAAIQSPTGRKITIPHALSHIWRQIPRELRPRQFDPFQSPERCPREVLGPPSHQRLVVVRGRRDDNMIWATGQARSEWDISVEHQCS